MIIMEGINHNSNGNTADSVSLKASKHEKEFEKIKIAKAKRRQKVSPSLSNRVFRFIVEQRIKEKE